MAGSATPMTLTANEARVLGCLMEKSVITPDQYPLTLNALTLACNQKTARDPVLSLDPGVVRRTALELKAKHLVRVEENFRRGVEKFRQRLCNTSHADYQLDPAEFAIVCLLLLRGPQTPGELRAHSGRLHDFADNAAVDAALDRLIERDGGPLVAQLPRVAGRRDSQYMHLFSGPVETDARDRPRPGPDVDARTTPSVAPSGGSQRMDLAELSARVQRLEDEVAELRARLDG